jgi:hypothetical protein
MKYFFSILHINQYKFKQLSLTSDNKQMRDLKLLKISANFRENAKLRKRENVMLMGN